MIETKNSAFPIGSYVFAHVGWRTHTVVDPNGNFIGDQKPYILPDFGKLPRSLGLGKQYALENDKHDCYLIEINNHKYYCG